MFWETNIRGKTWVLIPALDREGCYYHLYFIVISAFIPAHVRIKGVVQCHWTLIPYQAAQTSATRPPGPVLLLNTHCCNVHTVPRDRIVAFTLLLLMSKNNPFPHAAIENRMVLPLAAEVLDWWLAVFLVPKPRSQFYSCEKPSCTLCFLFT